MLFWPNDWNEKAKCCAYKQVETLKKIEQMDQVRICSACFLGSKISQRFVEFSNSGSK